jgi:hypothetical protein
MIQIKNWWNGKLLLPYLMSQQKEPDTQPYLVSLGSAVRMCKIEVESLPRAWVWARNTLGWGQMQNIKREKGRGSNGDVAQKEAASCSAPSTSLLTLGTLSRLGRYLLEYQMSSLNGLLQAPNEAPNEKTHVLLGWSLNLKGFCVGGAVLRWDL